MTMPRIAIVGMGVSGLVALKTLKDFGFEPDAYERSNSIGGIWVYDHGTINESSCCYESLTTNSSALLTHLSGCPIPDVSPTVFPTHYQMTDYFNGIADNYLLRDNILFNTTVTNVRKSNDNQWKLTSSCNETQHITTKIYDYVWICTGVYNNPYIPDIPGIDSFVGSKIHSKYYRIPKPYENKNVIIVGSGNSAFDIATELSEVCNKVTMLSRQGKLALPVEMDGVPIDQIFNCRSYAYSKNRQGMAMKLCSKITKTLHEHGLPREMESLTINVIKKPEKFTEKLENNTINLKRIITNINGNTITFDDLSEETYDDIIFCTGFKQQFPFLSEDLVPTDPNHPNILLLMDHVLHPKYHNLSFLCHIDTYGPNIGIAEIQSLYVGSMIAGLIDFPSKEDVSKFLSLWNKIRSKFNARSKSFVDYVRYADELGAKLGYVSDEQENPVLLEDFSRSVRSKL
eukprot:TRINITY_DN12233_c0_g1_i1.p1 TRINITY_DN12233_c0_g1~~TRINITY_DN12233_c0_g1_i1.p1  ORF type:complete len:458 (-),score=90.98 TRINITY_DN12233_c0_g1_i1:69-1442(-)